MTTALLTHPACLDHHTPEGHPERVDRLRAVLAALEDEAFQLLTRIEAPQVAEEAVLRAHDASYVASLRKAAPSQGRVALDPDTWMSPGSLEATSRVAGAAVAGVDLVLDGAFSNVFCAVRPPGHHAESRRAMGFCLYNGAAIAALHAVDARGLARAAVVDFDVHHGNGTQEIFERDGRLFYGSTHQWPFYPGTGAPGETGVGNIFNAPLQAFADSPAFRVAFEGGVLAPLEAFQPDILIISAGFDAHAADPLAQVELFEDDFVWATERLCDVADACCGGRVVSVLEGGYDLAALARSTAAHVATLMRRGVR